jgi:hypothetical protein
VCSVVEESRLAVSTRVPVDDNTLGAILEKWLDRDTLGEMAIEMVGVQWGLSESTTIRSPGWTELASKAMAVSTVSSSFAGINSGDRCGTCNFPFNPACNSAAATSHPFLQSPSVVSEVMFKTLRPPRNLGNPSWPS